MCNEDYQIPKGGCVKHTEGTFHQVFDANGNLVCSSFTPSHFGDDCEYYNEYGALVGPDDDIKLIHCHAPFDTTQPYD